MTPTETPPTHDELVEKLEKFSNVLSSGPSKLGPGTSRDLSDLLRATIAELKRGQEDARRLDWLEKQRDFEGFTNLSGGFSLITSDAFKGESLREAIDSAISSTAKEEA